MMITMQHVQGYRENRGGVGLLQVCADGSKGKPRVMAVKKTHIWHAWQGSSVCEIVSLGYI